MRCMRCCSCLKRTCSLVTLVEDELISFVPPLCITLQALIYRGMLQQLQTIEVMLFQLHGPAVAAL